MNKKKLEKHYIPFQCMIINNINQFSVEGVSTAQYEILDILEKEGNKTTKELTEIRKISQAGMSKLTKKLLDKDYIFYKRREIDRRIYDISITEAGKDFLKRSEIFRNTIINLIEKTLNDDELKCFTELCEKIVYSYKNE